MSVVYIGVGSNLGDRRLNIEGTRVLLQKQGLTVLKESPLYETKALCRPGESMPDFLNGVFEVETDLEPLTLLDCLESIERSLRRMDKGSWKPRTIDLDILLYEGRIYESPGLKIPHPEMSNRWFVLKPLADLVPNLRHPVSGKTVREMLSDLTRSPSGSTLSLAKERVGERSEKER